MPSVKLLKLPSEYRLAGAEIGTDPECNRRDALCLHVWVDHQIENQSDDGDEEAFKEQYCDGCPYFTGESLHPASLRASYIDTCGDKITDDDGEEIVEIHFSRAYIYNPCSFGAHDSSLESALESDESGNLRCYDDHIYRSGSRNASTANATHRFSLYLDPKDGLIECDGVVLQKLMKYNDTHLVSDTWRTMNVHNDAGPICWGNIMRQAGFAPSHFDSMVDMYFSLDSNDDLLSYPDFAENVDDYIAATASSQLRLPFIFNSTEQAEALICVNQSIDAAAFHQLLASGIQPHEDWIVTPALRHRHVMPSGAVIDGWRTIHTVANHAWFIAETDECFGLVGQILLPSTSCSSLTPSSSEPAALAGS